MTPTTPTSAPEGRLRSAVGIAAGLNLTYALVEIAVAAVAGSVSLFADATDFLEDAAVNGLVLAALLFFGPHEALRRARLGKAMAVIILVPAAVAVWEAIDKALHPEAPQVVPLLLGALGALVVNGVCAVLLARVRNAGGALSRSAWLAARNDMLINVAIMLMGGLTWWLAAARPGLAWLPDLLLGAVIIVLNVGAAKEVWEVAEEERLGAAARAGELPE